MTMFKIYNCEKIYSLLICLAVSTFTKGEQMVPVMNQLGIHCAVFGNHDFGEFRIACTCMIFHPTFRYSVTTSIPS